MSGWLVDMREVASITVEGSEAVLFVRWRADSAEMILEHGLGDDYVARIVDRDGRPVERPALDAMEGVVHVSWRIDPRRFQD